MRIELLASPRRATPPEAAAWKTYMPRWGNGGVPTQREVDRFVTDTRRNRELRQKVLGELRERAGLDTSVLLSAVVAAIAILALFATLSAAATGALSAADASAAVDAVLEILGNMRWIALGIFAVGIGASIARQGRARHAKSYLDAYSEAERTGWYRR